MSDLGEDFGGRVRNALAATDRPVVLGDTLEVRGTVTLDVPLGPASGGTGASSVFALVASAGVYPNPAPFTSATPFVVPTPSGFQPGDLLMAFVAGSTVTSISFGALTGWTQILGSSAASPKDGSAIYFRVSDGSEGASASFPFTAVGAMSGGGFMVAVRAADLAILVDQQSSAAEFNSSPVTILGVTTAHAGELVIQFFAQGGIVATPQWSAPAGTTLFGTDINVPPGTGYFQATCVFFTKAAAGAVPNQVWTESTSSFFWGQLVTIAPRGAV